MKTWTFLIIIIVAVLLANAVAMSRNVDCSYSNASGTFTFEEMNSKERNFDMCQRKFAEFKKQNNDTILFRLCRQNTFQLWNWANYLFQKKFQLPYMSWQEIEQKRGSVSRRSGFQDF